MNKNTNSFEEFMNVVRKVRQECPWDREQTHASLRQSFIEEVYEAIESIDANNLQELRNELGDVLLHVALQSVIAEEHNTFTIDDVLVSITEKLIRRHPHVFGEQKITSSEEQSLNWEKIKISEGRTSVVEGVPQHLPALQRAQRIQEKASKVGFDWKHKDDVWKKVEEELAEMHTALDGQHQKKIEEEFGDVLFSLVNYARFLKINPEAVLQATTNKFLQRFRYIENELTKQEKDIYATSLEEMDMLWNEAKKSTK